MFRALQEFAMKLDPFDWWILGFVVVGISVAIFSGYTTIWDRLCGTMRSSFERDFEKITTRPITRRPAANAPDSQAVRA